MTRYRNCGDTRQLCVQPLARPVARIRNSTGGRSQIHFFSYKPLTEFSLTSSRHSKWVIRNVITR